MRSILFPMSEKEYLSSQKRIAELIKKMTEAFRVEVWTASQTVYEDLKEGLKACPNLKLKCLKPAYLPLTFDFRDNASKIFSRYAKGITIPGTDLEIWKTAAFDDLWGHYSTCSFPEIKKIEADMVLLPLQSWEDLPLDETDVLYTSIALLAKEGGKKIVGYQLHPVFNVFKLMPRLMDGIIVRADFERQFYIDMGIAPAKVFCLSDPKDIYALSTIEDAYKNHLYNDQIPVRPDELSVVVLNHAKLRPQMREIFDLIAESKIPVVLSLVKRDFFVKDLSEDEIIKDAYFPAIKKIACPFYLVEVDSMVPTAMVSDVVISPAYVTPLEFAARYEKASWVYNPCDEKRSPVNGVRFIDQPEDFVAALKKVYGEKQKRLGMNDLLQEIGGRA